MNGSGENKQSIGADMVEGFFDCLVDVSFEGVLDVAGDAAVEMTGAVIGGIFDGI